MDTIIITPRSLSKGGHPFLERITAAGYGLSFPAPGAQPTEAQLEAVMADAVGWIAGVERIGARLLSKAPRLRAISRNGTGVDNVDLEAAAARGICSSDAEMKAGRWTRTKGFELEGKTLGLVGCGKIGRLVARFALAFDMEVLAYDPYPDASFAPSTRFTWTTLPELLARADAISLHCPPAPGGGPLLGGSELATLKKGAILINTARGSLVDPAALAAALASGRVGSYTVDAFDQEPPEDWSLAQNARVIATPHIGGFTDESVDRATEVAIDNLLAALRSAPQSGAKP
jgi:D-3-phosphoglycerate dehydrogenase / 2-oxoglutarate reductase